MRVNADFYTKVLNLERIMQVNEIGRLGQLEYEIFERASPSVPKIGDRVRLTCANAYNDVVQLGSYDGLSFISVSNGTEVTVLEMWNDYVRVKHGRYTKRWVHISHVDKNSF